MAAAKAEQWQQAAIAGQQAIKLEPADAWSYHHLGIALIELEQWSAALTVMGKSVELNPQFPWSYFHLGDIYARQKQWQKSTAAYRHFLSKEANVYAYERLGDSLLQQVQPFTSEAKLLKQEAFHCYHRAVSLDRDYLQPYYKLIELQPHNREVTLMLAETYARLEKWSTAVIFYQMGLQIDSKSSEVHFELGIVLEQLEQYADAAASYQAAIALNAHEPKYQSALTALVSKC